MRAKYRVCNLRTWFEETGGHGRTFIARHDVDRRPERALAMAELEASLGISASYYFRIVPAAFDPEIICRIFELGHEIGYHYEDWNLGACDKDLAIESYRVNLDRLRKLVPIETIAMHGSPLAKESNFAIWDHYDFTKDGVKDAVKSADFSEYAFFTDTGRTFGVTGANLRDFVDSKVEFPSIKTSCDLVEFLDRGEHDKVYFSAHPERWTGHRTSWVSQYLRDKLANSVKRTMSIVK